MSELPPQLRQHAAATARNRDPILAVLRRVAPRAGLVLEVASGTGEHAVYLAPRLNAPDPADPPGTPPRDLAWQPSDPDPTARASIAAWTAHEHAGDAVRAPLALDARDDPSRWPVGAGAAAMVVCINMIHIAPWAACVGLVRGAAHVLAPGGVLYLYGPYQRDGAHTAESNAAFDASLRARDPAWGVRDLGEVTRLAREHGLARRELVEMPANNLSVVFAREALSP